MAKRFINTDIFNDTWFMDLPDKYKLLWIYLITNCDHAGIWQVNFKTVSFFVGSVFEQIECRRVFKGKFIKTADEKFWLLPSFLKFQYGDSLNPDSKVHKSIINALRNLNLYDSYIYWLQKVEEDRVSIGYPNPIDRVIDIDKDKDMFKININKGEEENLSPKPEECTKINVQCTKLEESTKYNVQGTKSEESPQSSVIRRESGEEKSFETSKLRNFDTSKLPHFRTSKLLDWVLLNAPRVNKLKHPLTESECSKLLEDFDEKLLKEVLLDMENYKKLLSNYQSANLTLRKWLKIRENDDSPKNKIKNSLTPPPESPGGFKIFNPLTDKL